MNIKQALTRSGFAFLPAFEPNRSGADAIPLLGVPIALGEGAAVHTLTPRNKAVSTPNTYSGLFGLDAFPFHTDMAHWPDPPRYLCLRAVVGYEDVPTLVADGWNLVASVGEDVLHRAFVRPRRPVKGAMPLLRLFERGEQTTRLRWDQTFIRPASGAGRIGCTRFSEALSSLKPKAIVLARPGDTLIIDNWRILHARSAVPQDRSDRILERAYLEAIH